MGTTGRYATGTMMAICMAVVSAAAWGQVQRAETGHALDANPLVGSGGSNAAVPGYVPINGNDIVSGNVSGLAYFHGRTATISPYSFQGNTVGSSFNSFERQSAGGIPTTPLSAGQVFFQSSGTVSTAQGSLYSAPIGSGFQSGLAPSSSVSPLALTGGAITPSWGGGGIPVRNFTEGGPPPADASNLPGRAISSPLFGLRQGGLWTPAPTGGQPLEGSVDSSTSGDAGKNAQQQQQVGGIATPYQPVDASGQPAKLTAQDFGAQNGQVNEKIKGNIRQRVSGVPIDMAHANIADQATDKGPMRVSETYLNLERRLDAAEAADAAAGQKAGGASTAGQTGNRDPSRGAKPAEGAMGNTSGQASNGGDGFGAQSTDPTKPGYRPRSSVRERAMRLQDEPTSVLQVGKKVDPLKSLTEEVGGATVTPFDDLMKQGETLLKESKYLDAADAYQSALALKPDDPLALLGRGNAELAAGMYQSATYDLKFVFSLKPEMVSVRYMLQDYIPVERQNSLLKDLGDLTTNENMGNMASFLTCYLCYNTGRETELQEYLGRWQARSWHDQWAEVTQRAWGKTAQ